MTFWRLDQTLRWRSRSSGSSSAHSFSSLAFSPRSISSAGHRHSKSKLCVATRSRSALTADLPIASLVQFIKQLFRAVARELFELVQPVLADDAEAHNVVVASDCLRQQHLTVSKSPERTPIVASPFPLAWSWAPAPWFQSFRQASQSVSACSRPDTKSVTACIQTARPPPDGRQRVRAP